MKPTNSQTNKLTNRSIILVCVLILFFYGCSNNTTSNNYVKPTIIDSVGLLHNECLDVVFKELKANKLDQISRSMKTKTTEGLDYGSKKEVEEYAISIANKFLSEKIGISINEVKTRSSDTSVENSVTYTTAQQGYLDELFNIVNLENQSYDKLASRISTLERNINESVMTDSEKESVMYVVAVATHSASYWNSNYDQWNTLLNSKLIGKVKNSKTKGNGEEYEEGSVHFNPEDPRNYHMYNNGYCINMMCPDGAFFDEKENVCNMPSDFDVSNHWAGVLAADAEGALAGEKWYDRLIRAVLKSIGAIINK